MPRQLSNVRRAITTAIGTTLIMATLAIPTPAWAHNFGSGNVACGPLLDSNCIARDGNHRIYYTSLTPNIAYAASDTALYVYTNRTDVTMYQVTVASDVDAYLYDGDYGSGWWGVAYCPSSSLRGGTDPNVWCQPFAVKFNNGHYPTKFDSVWERDVLTCHELGHSVGLRDRGYTNVLETSCMIQSAFYSDYLNADDEAHLNAKY